MAVPTFTMRQLLEAGVHFGHHTRRWNPKMEQYIFGTRNKVHIIDLQQTVPMLYAALNTTRDIAAGGGRVLFVGTKRAASDIVAESARKCGQYYVNHRWLGGMLTNWKTISYSIKKLRDLETHLGSDEMGGLTKKELLNLTRQRDKLELALGGIKEMGGKPDMLVVIDTNKEEIAINEARKLGIPIAAVVDSNSNPNNIDFPIPGNDDAMRAIQLYCDLFAGAVLDGLQQEMTTSGIDVGEAEAPPQEVIAVETPAEPEAPAEAVAAAEVVAEAAAPEAPAEPAVEAVAEAPAPEAPAAAPETT
jgi:small subunit ribosomal protein S2